MTTTVTVADVQAIIDGYIVYARGELPKINKLVMGIHNAVEALGGTWEYDDENGPGSCFTGATIVCWRFSQYHPAEAVKLYTNLVYKNYQIFVDEKGWKHFEAYCNHTTNTLTDWQHITRELGPRNDIFQQALNVTTAMYGNVSPQGKAAEVLWDGRL